jgi:hypothetical protein
MNLREDKHWSYGSKRQHAGDAGPATVAVLSAPGADRQDRRAQSPKFRREVTEYVTSMPATATAEVTKVKQRDVRALSGQYETNAAVSGAIADIVRFDRPDDWVRTLKTRIEHRPTAACSRRATARLPAGRADWVIVGDLAQIESTCAQARLGGAGPRRGRQGAALTAEAMIARLYTVRARSTDDANRPGRRGARRHGHCVHCSGDSS